MFFARSIIRAREIRSWCLTEEGEICFQWQKFMLFGIEWPAKIIVLEEGRLG